MQHTLLGPTPLSQWGTLWWPLTFSFPPRGALAYAHNAANHRTSYTDQGRRITLVSLPQRGKNTFGQPRPLACQARHNFTYCNYSSQFTEHLDPQRRNRSRVVRMQWHCQVAIGRFSEAGLLEWMRFVIFRARSRERSQRTSRPISE